MKIIKKDKKRKSDLIICSIQGKIKIHCFILVRCLLLSRKIILQQFILNN